MGSVASLYVEERTYKVVIVHELSLEKCLFTNFQSYSKFTALAVANSAFYA